MLFLERSLVILSQSAVVGVHVHGTDGYAQEKHTENMDNSVVLLPHFNV